VSDPLVVIAGGYDKQLDLKPFVEILAKKAKSVLLIGQTAQVLFDALLEAQVSAEIVGSLDRAIQRARLLAKAGDMVIFSPAASSFDQFRDYVERGESFNRMVREL
jgi:UDP-N-acetylmuramoylalanine--D-glutamate ligase